MKFNTDEIVKLLLENGFDTTLLLVEYNSESREIKIVLRDNWKI